MPPRTDYMPPRNPKSVLYTVKTTISPDKKHTCLEMKILIFDGKRLEDGSTLEDYNITNTSTIHFRMIMRGD